MPPAAVGVRHRRTDAADAELARRVRSPTLPLLLAGVLATTAKVAAAETLA